MVTLLKFILKKLICERDYVVRNPLGVTWYVYGILKTFEHLIYKDIFYITN